MEYRAVGNRCAANLGSMRLPVTHKEALAILVSKGFGVLEVDLVALARQCIMSSKYRRSAKPSEAPAIVDCSSFIKWLYAQRGIWLPRRSIQQRDWQRDISPIPFREIIRNDVVFSSGWIDYYHNDPSDGVGHVGLATGEGTIIHAANKKVGVVETSTEKFVDESRFRGVRRYIPKGEDVLTFETPPEREIETADDIRWIILQSIPKH